ncbi:type II toxin-antitoxin system YafO family toxin [Rhodoferax sp.]|uniref:type II toxin-antitoxin system YafO family toxin n=1 Tax=Rhodoferax sp. TaxID=50421 RepID=UPI00261A3CD6|nr:type II toxin-antitoxin system YafO family toxin [Rhodoferax sp.]MDD2811747.1 type II toxin-antitoxin system YafO family toxin [Rhodoferax sp.]MDD4945110.1 type II toxin-antitoxin system YafO family toxin [Rhodoferax sp.]
MKVHVTSQLSVQLLAVSQNAEALLVDEFIAWKNGPEDGHYWFSQNKLGDDGHLFHVHLIPNNNATARREWNRLWRGPPVRPWKRRSDRYLLYADGKQHGYILIALLEDPGAHDLWLPKNKSLLQDFVIVADNFDFNGSVP